MAGEGDKTKGRVKQAAGDLTGDKDLERSGERDEKSGKAKEGLDKAKQKAQDGVDAVRDKFD
jgi:uncharacterized protein YjbJ (UPF0337 family)